MFEFDATKLLIIGVVALIVIGPKDLPRVLRQLGQFVAKTRRMAGEFQSQFMDAIKESELDDIRKDVASVRDATKLDIGFNPIATIRSEITNALNDKPAPAATPAAAPAVMTPLPAATEAAAPTPYGEAAEKNSIDLSGLTQAAAPSTEPVISAAVAPVAHAAAEPVEPVELSPRAPSAIAGGAGFTSGMPADAIRNANDDEVEPARPHLAKTGEA